MALAISREVQNRTGMSLRRFLRTLKFLRSATIDLHGVIATFPSAINRLFRIRVDRSVGRGCRSALVSGFGSG